MIKKMMAKWGIRSYWDFFVINVVFACAGMTIVYERKPLFELLGITETTPLWIKIAFYIPLIIPLYQLNLIIFGTLLGQFEFFWNKEKQMVRFLKNLIFGKKKQEIPTIRPTEHTASNK